MERKLNRDSIQTLGMIAMIAMLMLMLTSFAATQETHAETPEIIIDFEDYELGPVQGQHGWFGASEKVNIIEIDDAISGTQVMEIVDDSTTAAMGARYSFDPIVKGSIEWWVKADRYGRFVGLLENTSGDRVEWLGMRADGTFEYYNGTVREYTSATYQPGKWYRFLVDFDSENYTKNIYIFEGDKLIFWKETAYFVQIDQIDLFRFATISNTVGVYHIDDIRIRNAELLPPGTINELLVQPEQLNLRIGQSEAVEVLGAYTNGSIQPLSFEDSGLALVSENEEIAETAGDRIVGRSAGMTVVKAVYGQLEAGIQVQVFNPDDIPPYVNITPRQLERETDLYNLVIVAPSDPEWHQLGQSFADWLETNYQMRPEVMEPSDALFEEGWSGDVLLIGNLGNNIQMARLYGMRLAYADAVYPGENGYKLQTVVDPFDLGGNTVVLGASDLTGAQLGLDKLKERIDQSGGTSVPWLAEAELGEDAAQYLTYNGNPSESQVETMLRNADAWLDRLKPTTNNETDAQNLHYVFNRIGLYGELYQLTGHEGFGQVYYKLLKGYANFVNMYPHQAQTQLNERANMWTEGEKVIANWTVMEASELFSEIDRRQILSALYLTYEANSRDNYIAGAPPTGPRWNHQIFPAFSLAMGGRYFERFDLPEASTWKQMGDQIFIGNTSNISLDEGSDYLMHVPMTNIEYGFATGNLDFIHRTLRPSADLQIQLMDNLGAMSGGGDTYPFGYSNAYSWGHSQVLHAASWFFEDPIYQFLLERTYNGVFPGQRMTDLNNQIHRYIALPPGSEMPDEANYPRVTASKMDEGVYADLAASGSLEVDFEDAFHKLAFRFGFGLDDSYLSLDGLSAGAHGHQDGNTILEYSANQRIFLTDRDYIEDMPQHHNGIVIVKDGLQPDKPPLVEVEWVGDVEGTAISRSRVPSYNGTDWDRTIVSPTGSFYFILDELTIKEDGDYLLQNLWQSLGDASIRQDMFEVEQQGVTMRLQSLDESELRIHERYGHFMKYWKGEYKYPFADAEPILSEVKPEAFYQAGDRSVFINVLSSYKNGELSVTARRVNENAVSIREGRKGWLAVTGALHAEHFKSNGKFHLLGEDQLLSAGATEIIAGGETLTFEQPIIFVMDVPSGEWRAYHARKDLVEYDEDGNPIRQAHVDSGTLTWSELKTKQLYIEAAKSSPKKDWEKPKPGRTENGQNTNPMQDFRRVHHAAEQITATGTGDLNGDGILEFLIGGKDGLVEVLDDQGNVLWNFQAMGRVNEVTVQDLAGEPVVFAATEDWMVHAIDAEGNEKWRQTFPQNKERKGNLLGITSVRTAYLDGKEADPYVIVGTQFRYIYKLDMNGNILDHHMLYYYGIEDMEFADFDGDGKEEGFIGLEYSRYNYWNDHTPANAGTSSRGWKVVDVFVPAQEGQPPAALLGTKKHQLRFVQVRSGAITEVWERNAGGEVNDIRNGDFDGDGVPEILLGSDGFQFHVYDPNGTLLKRVTLDDRVHQVGGWTSESGETHYVAVIGNGGFYLLDMNLETEHFYRFSENIAGVGIGENNAELWIALENGEVFVRK